MKINVFAMWSIERDMDYVPAVQQMPLYASSRFISVKYTDIFVGIIYFSKTSEILKGILRGNIKIKFFLRLLLNIYICK